MAKIIAFSDRTSEVAVEALANPDDVWDVHVSAGVELDLYLTRDEALQLIDDLGDAVTLPDAPDASDHD
jgi:hypothetical protein